MESGSAAANSSTREEKPHKKHKANEIDDITNNLPEPLISRILSHLPTKDAVRTSVLSKRWTNIWTFINKLELNDSVFYSPKRKAGGKQHFINFVYRALLLIKCSSVESFSLVIASKYDVSLLNTWISNILNRKVKNLRISSNFNYEFPFSAFTCDTLFDSVLLEELVLEMCCCTIKVPSIHGCLQCLKLLKLSGVSFIYDSPTSFRKLVLPTLQTFETKNCCWLGAKGVAIEAPLLESVYIEQDGKSVSDEPRSCKISFFALQLKEFTYCGYGMSQYIFLKDPSSADNAAANILLNQCWKKDPETGLCAFILLKQFSQAKSINFDGSEVLTQKRVSYLPVFAMLTHLELGRVSAEVLLGLLQKSPVLKTLIFKGISIFDKEFLSSAVVPSCFASTLEVVKFEKVNGSEHELCLAKFFMENGMVLERISFSLVNSQLAKSKIMEEFKEKLFSFKKGFSFAIVEFSYD